ncbi:MAG: GNAT family N-acetyltransferase [Candidatus Heimdallarchaeota archaeon]
MFYDIDIIEEICDNNLYLRKLNKEDAQFFYESLQNENMTSYLSLGPLRSLEHSKRLIKNYLKSWEKYIQFNYLIVIRDKEKIKKVGSVSLWNISWLHRRAEIGIWLLPEYWEQGIGKKSLNLIKTIAFNHLKLNRIEAHIAVENQRSIKTFKNSEFKEEGILKKYLNLNGKYHDALILAYLERS